MKESKHGTERMQDNHYYIQYKIIVIVSGISHGLVSIYRYGFCIDRPLLIMVSIIFHDGDIHAFSPLATHSIHVGVHSAR